MDSAFKLILFQIAQLSAMAAWEPVRYGRYYPADRPYRTALEGQT
jgi:hypothetical protein